MTPPKAWCQSCKHVSAPPRCARCGSVIPAPSPSTDEGPATRRRGRIVHVTANECAFATPKGAENEPDVFVGQHTVQNLKLRIGDEIEYTPAADAAGRLSWAKFVKRVS